MPYKPKKPFYSERLHIRIRAWTFEGPAWAVLVALTLCLVALLAAGVIAGGVLPPVAGTLRTIGQAQSWFQNIQTTSRPARSSRVTGISVDQAGFILAPSSRQKIRSLLIRPGDSFCPCVEPPAVTELAITEELRFDAPAAVVAERAVHSVASSPQRPEPVPEVWAFAVEEGDCSRAWLLDPCEEPSPRL